MIFKDAPLWWRSGVGSPVHVSLHGANASVVHISWFIDLLLPGSLPPGTARGWKPCENLPNAAQKTGGHPPNTLPAPERRPERKVLPPQNVLLRVQGSSQTPNAIKAHNQCLINVPRWGIRFARVSHQGSCLLIFLRFFFFKRRLLLLTILFPLIFQEKRDPILELFVISVIWWLVSANMTLYWTEPCGAGYLSYILRVTSGFW